MMYLTDREGKYLTPLDQVICVSLGRFWIGWVRNIYDRAGLIIVESQSKGSPRVLAQASDTIRLPDGFMECQTYLEKVALGWNPFQDRG